MAIALGIPLGEMEFDIHIGSHIDETSHNLAGVRIQFAEVGIENVHCVMNLGIADVLFTIVMNDVEYNGDDVEFVILSTTL